jgi:hypothetical protein
MGSVKNALPFQGKNGWANLIIPGASSIVNSLHRSQPNLGQQPSAPQQIDYATLMNQALGAQSKTYQQLSQQQIDSYPKIQALQLGTASTIQNQLAADPNVQLSLYAAQQGIGQVSNLNQLGNLFGLYGSQALANSGPTTAEQSLLNQTGSDLALGSSLNPEEERAASQQASNAFAMRGLGTGQSAAAADILNRYQYGQSRLAQRQGAFTNADTSVNQNVLARSSQALGALGQAGSAYGQAATVGYQGANMLNQVNPAIQGLNYGSALSGQNLANTSGMANSTYNQALGMAGDVAAFNTNMNASLYNSYNNNQAALTGAQLASNSALWGAGIGALGQAGAAAAMACWVAREVYGEENPAWVQFRHWLLSFGSDRRVAKYLEHGPALAQYISDRPGWKTKVRRWMDSKRAELLSIQTLHAA